MNRVFIIGNASSVWMREYIREIHIENGDQVWVTSFDEIDEKDLKTYSDMGVTVVEVGKFGGIIGKLEKTINLLKFAQKHTADTDAIDWIEIQSPPVSFQRYVIVRIISILNCKVFTAFWGSDILAIRKSQAKLLTPILNRSLKINLPTIEMQKQFKCFFGDTTYSSKITNCKYGTLAFPHIRRAESELGKATCKEAFGLNSNKYCVAIGYNGKATQQHVKVINALAKLPIEKKNEVELLLHMGYGVDRKDEYYKEVEASLLESGFSYVILDNMLPLDNIGKLRIATDVFIHAQTTDAMSGTIRECIFAKAILVNPTWIRYPEYEKLGIEYLKYESFDMLPRIIEDYLDGKCRIDIKRNASLVSSMYSWDAVREDWLRVINR